jgi:hypothetical protein
MWYSAWHTGPHFRICTNTKVQRIDRHDEIKNLIADEATKKDKETAVTLEPTIRTPASGNLKPDLVVQSQGRVFVVDVTVLHEDGNLLAQGRQAKLEKYEPLLPTFQEQLWALSGEALPIVVGTRKALPKETIEALRKLKITDRKTPLTISLIASIKIYHAFMDYKFALRLLGAPTTLTGKSSDQSACRLTVLTSMSRLFYTSYVAGYFTPRHISMSSSS